MTDGDKIKLRAELAGKAMQGMLSNSHEQISAMSDSAIVRSSVEIADALMKELGLDGE